MLLDEFYSVYVVAAAGNDGGGGLQTVGVPAVSFNTMAVASVDNIFTLRFYTIIAPDGRKIPYRAGADFGGWKTIINSTVIVNSQYILYYDV